MSSARPELRRLSRALDGLRAGPSVEAVHDVRVSCRRLDVFLRLGGRRALRDDLRWLRSSLGALRDLDVIRSLGVPLDEATTRFLAEERRRLAVDARSLARHPRTRALVRALAQLPPLSEEVAQRTVPRLSRRLGEADGARTFTRLHDERRAVRRLRFAKEWLGLDASGERERQALLGVVCDVDALRRFAVSRKAREAARLLSRAVNQLVRLLTR